MSNSVAREPWFLEGRRSVLLRAIWTTLVLGGLAFFAGFLAMLMAFVLILSLEQSISEEYAVFLFEVPFVIVLTAFVGLPYWFWLRAPLASLVARGMCLIGFIAAPSLIALTTCDKESLSDFFEAGNDLLGERSEIWREVPFEFLALFSLLWLAFGMASLQHSRLWFCAVFLSAVSVPLTAPLIFIVSRVQDYAGQWVPGSDLIASGTFGGQFLVLLVVPWGIVFWFPPHSECPPVEGPSPQA